MKYLKLIKPLLAPFKPLYKFSSFIYNKYIISSNAYWENRYKENGNSGSGSYGRLAEFKSTVINDIIQEFKIQTVSELGVGDGNNLKLYKGFKKYIGYDVSKTIVNRNRDKFPDNKYQFYLLDEIDIQKSELFMSLDVIYHLIEDSIYLSHINQLFSNSSNLVLIYSSNYNSVKYRHVRHRKFSDDIPENYKLIKYIQNKYPAAQDDPENTSIADFYLYQKIY